MYESNDHKGNFLECVKTRKETIAPAEVGHRSCTVCLLGNIAMQIGRKLRWNPDVERFVDDAGGFLRAATVEADRWIAPPMRGPWRI